MPFVFQYFWFLGAAVMLVNVLVWRYRLAAVVDRGAITRREADQFALWATIVLVGGPLLLGIIAFVARWTSPFCAGVLAFGSPAQALVSCMMILSWLALLWWVWRGGGDDFIARAGPALSERPVVFMTSPRRVRIGVTALILVSSIGALITSRTMPTSPELACPAVRQ